MKNIVFLTLFLSVFTSNAQRISLNELQTFCSNKNWETTNKTLLAQKWDYYNSKEGDDEHYNIITWAYGRNYYDDSKASGWIYLDNYDGLPNKIKYRFRQKEYYTAIQSQLKTFAYILIDESIFDERVTTTYENKQFILKIAYNREEDDKENDYSNFNNYKKTFTVYEVSIFKKGGVYDPNNGLKKEYDEDGNLTFEYVLKNGKYEGLMKEYNSEGKIKVESNFKNGLKEGISNYYFYSDSSEDFIRIVSNFKNGRQTGRETNYFESATEKYIIGIHNYKNDLLEGKSYQSKGEIIKVKNYSNGILNGSYKEYLDVKTLVMGGIAKIDTLSLPKTIIVEQSYSDNKLNGISKSYDISGSLTIEGTYKDSLKTGAWKYYYDNISDGDGNKLEYAGKLFLIENYSNDMLNGKSEQFSYINKIPCIDGENEDDCFKNEIVYVHLINHYKDDELEGEFILKYANGDLYKKGVYLNGFKVGKWIEYGDTEFSEISDENRNFETGNYLNDKKEGKWERFLENGELIESYFYKDGLVDGKHITYIVGKPFLNKYFNKGTLIKVEFLKDSKITKTIEIVSNDSNSLVLTIKTVDENDFKEINTFKIDKYRTNLTTDPKYFPLNLLAVDKSYKILNGFFETRDAHNRIISTGNYDSNVKTGEWNDYYYDQNVKTTFKFNYGKIYDEYYFDLKKNEPFSDEFIYKDIVNNITEERKIKNGLRHGTTRYKDQNNKTIKKESYKEGQLKE